MNYTSMEQSKHLLELGLDVSSADMHYLSSIARLGKPYSNSHIPCWSVGKLLELMPNVSLITREGDNIWCTHNYHSTDDYTSAIDACYEMIVWLLEQGYIK